MHHHYKQHSHRNSGRDIYKTVIKSLTFTLVQVCSWKCGRRTCCLTATKFLTFVTNTLQSTHNNCCKKSRCPHQTLGMNKLGPQLNSKNHRQLASMWAYIYVCVRGDNSFVYHSISKKQCQSVVLKVQHILCSELGWLLMIYQSNPPPPDARNSVHSPAPSRRRERILPKGLAYCRDRRCFLTLPLPKWPRSLLFFKQNPAISINDKFPRQMGSDGSSRASIHRKLGQNFVMILIFFLMRLPDEVDHEYNQISHWVPVLGHESKYWRFAMSFSY